jgi:hypothetical protein
VSRRDLEKENLMMNRKPIRRFSLRLSLALCLCATALAGLTAASASAFDFTGFSGSRVTPSGTSFTQAGAHPDLITELHFSTYQDAENRVAADGNVKDVYVDLPPGAVGNPTAVPKCTAKQLAGEKPPPATECPAATQVGRITLGFACCMQETPLVDSFAIYNVVPPHGVTARFGFNFFGTLILVDGAVRGNGEYRIGADSLDIPQTIPLASARVVFWGVPADSSHDAQRYAPGCYGGCASTAPRTPFMSNPVNCAAGPQATRGRIASWQEPGVFHELSFDKDSFGKPLEVSGCDNIEFHPRIRLDPSNTRAASPAGVSVNLEVPQNEGPDSLASAQVKRAEVKLPVGMSISPSASNGLDVCTLDQIKLNTAALPECPKASKLGELELDTPLLDEQLTGGIYLAKQFDNPFKSMIAMYLTMVNVDRGVVIKIPGRIDTDSRTGQVTIVFDDSPQLPFSNMRMRFNGGERSTLINPPTCGIYTTETRFVPWSASDTENPAPSDVVRSANQIVIDKAPDGGPCQVGDPNQLANPSDAAKRPFRPKMTAGSVNVQAGASSQFDFKLKRGDNEQELVGITTTLPPGLTGSLKGVTECSEATIASIPTAPGTAQAELERPTCPASSHIGTVNIGAGVGQDPYYTTAQAYLSGPYKGSPLSFTFVAAAKAGPFDFGNVIVRAKLVIDPVTTQVKVVSDPVPHIFEGVPLRVQDVRIQMNRPDFIRNPTSCDPMSIDGLFTGAGWDLYSLSDDVSWAESNRFQVAGCAGLGFKPKVAFKLKGGTHRGDFPALSATVTARPGDANIAKTAVTLPHSEFLAQEHIRTICTRAQFAQKNCPAASIYGKAKATSPLIDGALEGPVYLRSSSNRLPDLVADLNGRFNVVLSGRIDSVNQGIRNTFDLIPDAPVSTFTLSMQGGKKGLLVNSQNLCKSVNRADVRMVGQNGKAANSKPVVVASACKKKSHKGANKRKQR